MADSAKFISVLVASLVLEGCLVFGPDEDDHETYFITDKGRQRAKTAMQGLGAEDAVLVSIMMKEVTEGGGKS